MASRLIWIFQICMCPPTLSSDFDETKRSPCAFICVRLIFCIKLPLIGPFFFLLLQFIGYSNGLSSVGTVPFSTAFAPPSPPGHGGVFVLPNACEQLMLAILAGGVNISATQTHMKRQLNELMEGVLLFDVSIG